MKKQIQFTFLILVFTSLSLPVFSQADTDGALKETLYKKYKKEAQAYDKKKFDALFMEFFQKEKGNNIALTKEEFYTYTVKIAAYSEKLGLLYKDQKEEAETTKKVWLNKSYADYLNSKK